MNIHNFVKLALPTALLSLCLLGCTSTRGPNESAGMVIGGIIGGVLGHQVGSGHGQTAATLLGTIIGTSIGGNVGRSMDEADRLKVAHSLETVRTGVSTSWRNPDTGNYYHVVPTSTYDQNGEPCREFQIDATIGSEEQKIYGTACRQADGSWKMNQ